MSGQQQRPAGLGTAGFYLSAAVATAVSADTSWMFFGDVLEIEDKLERSMLFGVVELTLIACGYAMRAAARRGEHPGPVRWLVWAMCGAAGYMAYAGAGPVAGTARIILGPVLAVVALHLAIGVTLRSVRGSSTGTMARVRAELRERILSRLGLGDDSRDAAARTRDRAADRAARLATARWVIARRARLARAVRVAGVAVDHGTRARMLSGVATYRHIADLGTISLPSPWLPTGSPPPLPVAPTDQPPVAPTALPVAPTGTDPVAPTALPVGPPVAPTAGHAAPTGSPYRPIVLPPTVQLKTGRAGSSRGTDDDVRQIIAGMIAAGEDPSISSVRVRAGIGTDRARRILAGMKPADRINGHPLPVAPTGSHTDTE